MGNPIAEALAKKSMPMGEPITDGDEPDADDSAEDTGPNPEEIDAMRMFERAKTTEQKAEALKTFIKACMPEAY